MLCIYQALSFGMDAQAGEVILKGLSSFRSESFSIYIIRCLGQHKIWRTVGHAEFM